MKPPWEDDSIKYTPLTEDMIREFFEELINEEPLNLPICFASKEGVEHIRKAMSEYLENK